MKNIIFMFLIALGFNTAIQSITVLEFCKVNPNHKCAQHVLRILDQAKPRFYVVKLWRLMVGTDRLEYNPRDLQSAFFTWAAEDIGKELGWDKEKIDAEIKVLLTELERIQKG